MSRRLRIEPLEERHLLNAAPTDILLPLTSVLEQQQPGTPVGMFATVDPDALDTFRYTLVFGEGSKDNASFTIDSIGDLLTASQFDFQSKSAYSIRVRSTDQAGLWFEKTFTVTVTQLTGRRVDLVSTALLSASGNDNSETASMSGDGRYVAFESNASNLVSGDTNGASDIFVKDLISGVTTRVSTDSSTGQANAPSYAPSISDDGRYVAFYSTASNLVSGDTNQDMDVFVKDLVSGVTTRVSTDSSAGQANSSSWFPRISGDGRHVAFQSYASNLVPGDTNGYSDIFVKDLVSGVIARVSTDSSAGQANSYSYYPCISGDGRYVAFESDATNLLSGDTNGSRDIFVKDVVSGVTTRVSTDSSAGQGNGHSFHPCLSSDGRYVAFDSVASNLVSGDTNGTYDVFVKDMVSEVTTRVSTDSSAKQGSSWSFYPRISGDGRYVAFESLASDLVTGDTNGKQDVFVKDLVAGVTARASTDSSAGQANGDSYHPTISDDGLYVAFHSFASNLHRWDTTTVADVFRVSTPMPPTDIAISSASIAENQPVGAKLGTFSASDLNAAQTFTYALVPGPGDSDNAAFTIVAGQLKTAAKFDFETKNSYTIRVRTTDQDGLSFEKPFTITITDVFDFTLCGVYDPALARFYLRNTNTQGPADNSFLFGAPGWEAISGDWDGDGQDTIGSFQREAAQFYLRNSNDSGNADISFGFGVPGSEWVLLMGDWNGDGVDTIGSFDPAASQFYLRNANSEGMADLSLGFGAPGAEWTPVVGDWNGDGVDTVGLYDADTGMFYLRNSFTTGVADVAFAYGVPGHVWVPLVGDWNGDGVETAGMFLPSASTFFLRNSNTIGNADLTFGLGYAGCQPLIGDWLGRAAVAQTASLAESPSTPTSASSTDLVFSQLDDNFSASLLSKLEPALA